MAINNTNNLRQAIFKLRKQGQTTSQIVESLGNQGFTASPGGGQMKNYVNYVIQTKARRVGTGTRTKAASGAESTTRYRMKNQGENWASQGGQATNNFAVEILERNDLDSDQKVRLLSAYFGNET